MKTVASVTLPYLQGYPAETLAQPIAPLSVTCLRNDGARWHVDCVNHIA